MPKGSCLCGNVAYEYSGEPQAKALCHCTDCQKISGSAYSVNVVVTDENLKVTKGKVKEYETKADSGRPFTSYFCDNCGVTLFRKGPVFPNAVDIKVGTLDDADRWQYAKPGAELYATRRVPWVKKTDGTDDVPEMPPN